MSSSKKNIVVIGAGVAGLTTALLLSRKNQYNIVVAAKHMPGDYDIEYAPPWAGANYMPVSVRGTLAAEYDKNTWAPLADLAKNHPEAGVHFQDCEIRNRAKDVGSATSDWFAELLSPDPWFKDVVPNFRLLPDSELGPGVDSGTVFTSVCINTAIYLPWLVSECLKNGVVFRRAVFDHIADAARPNKEKIKIDQRNNDDNDIKRNNNDNTNDHDTTTTTTISASSSISSSISASASASVSFFSGGDAADLVVNCTGLMASKLGGVEDKTVVPARGQIVIVRNETGGKMMDVSGTDDGPDEACYIMTRAAGGGTILGGSYQKGSWESQPDPNLATRIMKRAVELCPALTGGKGKGKGGGGGCGIENLDVIRHGVGLRPVREGGVRIEREDRLADGVPVVHNYGAGGAGYQSSYGCAQAAVNLVEEAFAPSAKL